MRPELMLPTGLDAEAVVALQDRLLCEHVHRLAERSPHYQRLFRELGLHPGDIRSVADLHRLPFTRNTDLEAAGDALLCVERRTVIDHVTTSGTTGKPVAVLLDEPDLERLTANEHNSLVMAGVTRDDVVQLMTTLDRRFMAGLAYFLGARALGAGVVRAGPGAAALQWDSIHRFGTTTLVTVPSFLVKLIDHARAHGIDPARSTVRKALCIGEPIHDPDGGWNNLGRRIKEGWDIELLGTYASTEMATACTETREGSGHAIQPQLMLVEVLDEHDRPVAHGQAGEVVVTPFHVSAMPLLRYRTGDYVKKKLHRGRLALEGGILSRIDDMLVLRGVNIYPSAIDAVVSEFPEIVEYLVEQKKIDDMDEIELLIETDPNIAKSLLKKLEARLRDTFSLRIPVRLVDSGSLPRHEFKAKRWRFVEAA